MRGNEDTPTHKATPHRKPLVEPPPAVGLNLRVWLPLPPSSLPLIVTMLLILVSDTSPHWCLHLSVFVFFIIRSVDLPHVMGTNQTHYVKWDLKSLEGHEHLHGTYILYSLPCFRTMQSRCSIGGQSCSCCLPLC